MKLFLAVALALVCVATATKPSFLGKSYKLDSSENFDDYMKALGVGWFTRTIGAAQSPTVTVTYDDGSGFYTMKTESTFKNQVLQFKLGEEFDEETPDGREVKTTFTLKDSNTLMQVQKGDKVSTVERIYYPNQMTAIMKVDDIVCTRIYTLED